MLLSIWRRLLKRSWNLLIRYQKQILPPWTPGRFRPVLEELEIRLNLTPALVFTTYPTPLDNGAISTIASNSTSYTLGVTLEGVVGFSNDQVNLAISGGPPGGGFLSAPGDQTLASNLASWAGLEISAATAADAFYTVTATDVTNPSVSPATMNWEVSPAAASQLVITQTPGTTTAGQLLSPALQVSAEDPYGNVETGSSAPVTVSVASGPGSFASGTLTVNAVNGVANFTDLVLDTAGNYTLTASDTTDGLNTNSSNSFTVNPAAASQLVITQTPGSSLTSLAPFGGNNGLDPQSGVIMDSNGDLFGATEYGGDFGDGTVYEVVNGSNTITTLASFTGGNGANPYGDLILDSNGNLYGTTYNGGANGDGTVYEIAKGSNTITTLASFNGSNGANPHAGVVLDSSGNLYGTTENGGADGDGTVYELALGSSTISVIASFDGSNGANPYSGVVLDSHGNLFGTTYGDSGSGGTVFEVVQGSNTVTTLGSFNGTNGANPYGGVILDSNGNLYGSTYTDGGDGVGTVFELANGSGTITTLASFFYGQGESESGVVMDSSGNLYGTTNSGGTDSQGTVFELPKGSSTITTLASFNGNNGSSPSTALTLDSNGNLYGTAIGGASGDGTVYEVAQGSGTITTIATLNVPSGAYPLYGGVIVDNHGILYGTTAGGGANGYGTVYELFPGSNTINTLASFNNSNGAHPGSGVVMDSSGNLYGTTGDGGTNNDGVVFELASGSQTITALASFSYGTNDGPNGLTVDSSGDLFGTTQVGGANGDGTIFELAHGSSTITTLASFDFSTGISPLAGVTLDSNGDLFGTTYNGGTNNEGIVYELANGSSTITVLASFTSSTGGNPAGGVILDSNGNLFGTSTSGGSNGQGQVYELANGSGMITTLASFTGSNGATPYGSLVRDGNGNFYGTTSSGGAEDEGTVFELANGTITPLGSFNTSGTGTTPLAGVVLGSNGTLYGTAASGGENINTGTVFAEESPTVGQVLSPALQADLEDQYGNLVTDSTDAVTVSANGPGPFTSGSTTTVDAVNGVATFSNLTLDTAGTYTLTVSDTTDGLTPATTTSFTVGPTAASPAATNQLVITQTPGSSTAGQALSPSLQVSVEDPLGNVETGSTAAVTVTVASGPGSFASGSTTTVNAVNGVATFSNLVLNTAGTYTLTATDTTDGLTSASTTITVSPAAASQLAVNQTPGATATGQTLSPSLQVDVEDPYGNLVAASTASITVAANGPGGFTPGSTTVVNAVNGVATFSNLVLDTPGTYTLTATDTADGLTSATTSSFVVNPLLVVTQSPGTTTAGQVLNPSLQVSLEDANGNVVTTSTAPVTVSVSSGPGGFASGTLTVNAVNGVATFSNLDLDTAGTYTLAASDPTDGLNTSSSTSFTVSPAAASQLVITQTPGSSLTSLAPFGGNNGLDPQSGVIMDSNGDLFGATAYGGGFDDGTVYEVVNGSNTITTLASFTGGNGAKPYGDLILDSNGNLYGTTYNGGANGDGTVYEIAKGSNTITTLASFNGTNGSNPHAGVVLDSSGNLYGTTENGGADGDGTVYELALGSSTISVIASFDGSNGANPYSGVVLDSHGNLFGTTTFGGLDNAGTVFEVAQGSNTITTLDTFNGTNGANPYGGVILDSAGNLYGSTYTDGGDGVGTVFELANGSGTITTLASFFYGQGESESGVVMDSSGNLYGTTNSGGTDSQGTVFELPEGSSTITRLASFNSNNGSSPSTALTLDSNGNLFGTAIGGASGDGTVYEVAQGSGTITTIATLNVPNGAYPLYGGVIVDNHGILYGTTAGGGANGYGTVYELFPGSNTINTLASFNNSNGAHPGSGVVMDSSGNLYGTTGDGGTNNDGVVFELASGSQTITALASFSYGTNDGPNGLTLDSNGDLFGTTQVGGANGDGTIFELAHGSSTITTLASFNYLTGLSPQAGVTLDSNGNLFGTTNSGGANYQGTVYELPESSSTITVLASFNGSNGSNPAGGVILDSSGNLFGTTNSGGANGAGDVYELANDSGTITTLAFFNGSNGANPYGSLSMDGSGNLFGATYNGGTNDDGTVYELASGSGTITTLASFNSPSTGTNPQAGVALASNGNLYGTASTGGENNAGMVFAFQSPTVGQVLSPALQAKLEDPYGNLTDSTDAVTVSANGPGPFTNGSTTTVNAVNGVATFSNLTLDTAGTYTLTVSDTTDRLTPATTTSFTVSPAAASPAAANQLVITQTPGSSTAGQALSPSLQVSVEDPLGNVETSSTAAVTVAVASGPGSFASGSTTTVNAVNGVATFSNLVLNTAGTYTLTATDTPDGLSSASTNIVVSPAAASQLAVTQTPGTTAVGQTLSPSLQVDVEDPYGNRVAASTASITVAANGPGGFTPGSTTVVNAVNGVATFSNLILDTPGTYTLTTTDPADGLTSATSSSFVVNPLLVVTQSPGTTTAGQVLNPSLQVSLEDSIGNVVTTSTAPVTVSVSSGPGGFASGTLTVNAVNGVATFSNLVLDTAGTYTLAASDPTDGLNTSYSTSFTVNPAAASQLVITQTPGSSLTSLAPFGGNNGLDPQSGVIMDSNGDLFGATAYGGGFDDGTVYEVVNGSNTITTLASFTGGNGAKPYGDLILDSNGNLYGTTYNGGANGDGTVYEIAKGSNTITTLASFNGSNGSNPHAGVVLDSSGDLYGTTEYGGASGDGTVYELASGSGTITTLASFTGSNGEGANPYGGVVEDSNGNLFGTTYAGGTNTAGTVFEVANGSNAITTLGSFTYSNGGNPYGGVILDSSGNLYGTTSTGGQDDWGTVFEVASGSTTISTLAYFTYGNGNSEAGLSMDSSGNLFGTTASGGTTGYYDGTVFELSKNSTTITTLASFDGTNGSSPPTGVIVDSNDNVYGTAIGGAYGDGTVYEVADGSGTISTLASLNIDNGTRPNYAGVIVGSNGNLYGTAGGGATGDGTIFELAPGSNSINTLASFDDTNGAAPLTGVIMDSNGDLFGTTTQGGAYNDGTVFELAKGSNTITLLASFDYASNDGPNGVTLDSSGDLFGTTQVGGAHGDGTIFEVVNGSGTITTLASFDFSTGLDPQSGVTLDSNGDLFGTTINGGTNNEGTVYELANGSSTITVLASFTSSTGGNPAGGVILDGNGNLFGTSTSGGSNGKGQVYELANGSGTITTLASFTGSNGSDPYGSLAQDGSGNFYGTTSSGGAEDEGTVFELANDTITTLGSFNTSGTGTTPETGLVLGSNGTLYGTTDWGGENNNGTVFAFQSPTVGQVLSTALQADLEDPYGNLVTDSTDAVTVSANGPGPFTNGSTTTVNAVNGVATFSNLTLDTAGTYTLTVSDTTDGLTPATTTSFTVSPAAVSPAAANQLVITQTPVSSTAGQALSPSLQVSVEDPLGNVETGSTATVTVTVASGPGSFASGSTTTVNAVNGVATFSNLVLNTAGTYTLTATDTTDGLTSASTTITVSPAAASQLVITQTPGTSTAGQALSSSLQVSVEDPLGNVETGSTAAVTVTVASGPGSFAGGSTTTVNAVNGVATFSNLVLNTSGTCTLTATDTPDGLTSASTAITVSPSAASQLVITQSPAYTFSDLASFGSTIGSSPYTSVVLDSNGDVFSTTLFGGPQNDGTIYEIARGSNTITTLATFNGTNGSNPLGTLAIDSSGNLYGTTWNGGAYDDGTIFELAAGSGIITTLATFNDDTGYTATGLVMDSSGNLFGATGESSTSYGTIFELAAGSGTITTLATFNDSNGANPNEVIVDSGDNVYGTTSQGGAYGLGTVFELANGSGTITTLASFDGNNGENPYSGVALDSSGNLYGTTAANSSNNDGTVFEVVAGSGTITTLATFNGGSGVYPGDNVILDSSGNLFGTTTSGGDYGDGTVFELPAGSDTIATLASFNGTDGYDAETGVTLDSSGNLFGTTINSEYGGTVFEVVNGSGTVTTLASFNQSIGTNALGKVMIDQSGNLFGTTSQGGLYADGTVYEVAAGSDTITTLTAFNSTSGYSPEGGVVEDSSGNLFGTTTYGGAYGYGTIFELAAGSGTITTLASFDYSTTGGYPSSSLVRDSNGDLFGATSLGGADGDGTVYELPYGSSTITPLATFDGSNGSDPNSSVTLDSNGNLFGATTYGGANNNGTVYELAAGSGTITTLASFNGGSPSYPSAAVLDGSGNLFGTTEEGGADSEGTVYEIAAGSGTITTLATFNGNNGSYPDSGVVLDSSGNLFGTTFEGGASSQGTVYELAAGSGTITTLTSFNDTNGFYSGSGVTLDSSGNLFGTTVEGGLYGFGTVYELEPQKIAGEVLSPSLQVSVEDAYGNVVTNSTATVTVFANGPGSFASGSTTTVAAVNGVATFSNMVLNTAGTYTLTATDTPDGLSSATTGSITVNPVPSMASTTNPTVLANVPSGFIPLATFNEFGGSANAADYRATVTWGDGSSGSSTGTNPAVKITVSGGVVTVSGNHTYSTAGQEYPIVTLDYEGASASTNANAIQVVVNPDSTTTTLTPSPSNANPSVYEQSLSFTATVANASIPGLTPTGSVTFYNGTTPLDTVNLTGGLATYTSSALAIGTYAITATYNPTTDFTTSASATPLQQTINPDSTTTTITASLDNPNPSAFEQSLSFTATVANASGTGLTPTGTVTFYNGTTPLDTVNLTSGSATYTSSALAIGTYSITATYNPTTDFVTSASATPLQQTINPDSTTTTISASLDNANPSAFEQSLSFTATVVNASIPGLTPTGSVSFYNGTAFLDSVNLTSGSATFTSSTLALGSYSITATYDPTTDFAASASNPANPILQIINPDSTTTTISAASTNANPSAYGLSLSFTATVANTSVPALTPTGMVTFFNGSTPLASFSLVSGSATYTTTTLAVATYSLTASYSATTDFTASASTASINQTVTTDSTTTTLTASATNLNPSYFGQPLSFTATVANTSVPGETPTGSVLFYNGTAQLGSVDLVSGSATFTSSTLVPGTYSITASYGGTLNFAASASLTGTQIGQTINADTTTTTLTASSNNLNPSFYGQSLSFTATVANTSAPAATPTGTVTFYNGTNPLDTVNLASGSATFTTSTLAVGTYSITATYNNPTGFLSSASNPVPQTIQPDSTTTGITASSNAATFSQTIEITATVANASAPGITPTGTVTFHDVRNGVTTLLGTQSLVNGAATYTTSSLALGSYSITASFSSPEGFLASNGSLQGGLKVNQGSTTTTVHSSTNPSFYGQTETFTANVIAAAGTFDNLGKVQFAVDGTNFGKPVAISGGNASINDSGLSPGIHLITATYSGDANFTGSSSASPLSQSVNADSTSTNLSPSLNRTNPATYGQARSFTATVANTSVSGETPTGTVNFYNGTTLLKTLTLVAGSATYTTSTLSVGSYSLTARYNGTTDFASSASNPNAPILEAINPTTTATSVTASHTSAQYGQSLTFTIKVTNTVAPQATPTGTVTLMDVFEGVTTVLETVNLVNGTATFTTSKLARGTHTIEAFYNPTTDFTASSDIGSMTVRVGGGISL